MTLARNICIYTAGILWLLLTPATAGCLQATPPNVPTPPACPQIPAYVDSSGFAQPIDAVNHPLPVAVPGGINTYGLTSVPGTQVNLVITSATAPTVPTGATILLVNPQGTNNTNGICAYWRDDGTAPTTSAGQAMPALQAMFYKVVGSPITFIQASGATCTMTISYFK